MSAKNLCLKVGLFLACASQPFTAIAKSPKIPEQTVISTYSPPTIDTSGASAYAGSGPLDPQDPLDLRRYETTSRTYSATIRMLDQIMLEVMQAAPVKSIRPKIRVLNQQKVEAKAYGTDLIIVSTGLLKALTSANVPEDVKEKDLDKFQFSEEAKLNSLAYILAHEYAHLLYKHPIIYQQKEEETKGFTKAIGAGIQLLHATQTLNAQIGGTNMNQEFNDANKVLYGAAVASPWVEAELYRFQYSPYVKDAEQMADYMATDLLTSSTFGPPKYNAEDGAQLLRGLYEAYDDSVDAKLKRLGKEAADTAKDASLKMAATAPNVALSGGDVGSFMEGHLKLAITTFGLKKLFGRLNKGKVHLYYSSDKRVDAVEEYFDAFYTAETPEMSASSLAFFEKFKSTFTEENTPAAAAEQAMEFLAKGDIEGALKALQSVTSADRLQNTQYLKASGDVAFANAQFGQAISYFNQAKLKGDVDMQVFRDLSKSYMMLENETMAINALDEGMEKFGTEAFIVEKISLLVILNKDEEVMTTYAACKALPDEDIVKECYKTAKPVLEPDKGKGGFLKSIGDTVKDTTGL